MGPLVASGGTAGINVGDVITLAGVAYTGAVAENVTTNSFLVATAGSPAQNITDTSNSLCRVVNKSASNTLIYAYYMSAYSDLPGKLLFQARSVGASAFTIAISAHANSFSPNLTASRSSIADTNKNGIFVSQSQQPEAVPITSFFLVGSAAKEILRIIALRDTLYILKEDGVFRLVGDSPSNFQIYPLDLSTKLLAPDSAVVLANQIYCLTDQGICTISDNGVQVISRPIEDQILKLIGANLNAVKSASFGVSYETDRKYILFLPSSPGDTTPTQAFVYNIFTSTFTRWTRSQKCGIVKSDDNLLYLADSLSSNVNVERKSYTFRDFIDEGTSNAIISATATVVKLNNIANVSIGDLLYQSATQNSQIIAIDSLQNLVTLQTPATWTVGACVVNKGINAVLEWHSNSAGNPGTLKHFRDITLLFKNQFFPTAQVGFWSESSNAVEYTPISGSYGGLWGLAPWGSFAWGGAQVANNLRTYIPLEKSRCTQLSIRFSLIASYTQFQLKVIA